MIFIRISGMCYLVRFLLWQRWSCCYPKNFIVFELCNCSQSFLLSARSSSSGCLEISSFPHDLYSLFKTVLESILNCIKHLNTSNWLSNTDQNSSRFLGLHVSYVIYIQHLYTHIHRLINTHMHVYMCVCLRIDGKIYWLTKILLECNQMRFIS